MRIAELVNRYKGEHFYIVGMGPSLLNLRREHIGTGPIIAIYESIHLVEDWGLHNPVYSLQKDGITGLPKYASLLVHAHESAKTPVMYEPQYIFDNQKDFGMQWDADSGHTAVWIAYNMGMRDLTMLCFDASTRDDRRRAKYKDGKYYIEEIEDFAIPYLRRNVDGLMKSIGGKCNWITPQAEDDFWIPVESTFAVLEKDFPKENN